MLQVHVRIVILGMITAMSGEQYPRKQVNMGMISLTRRRVWILQTANIKWFIAKSYKFPLSLSKISVGKQKLIAGISKSGYRTGMRSFLHRSALSGFIANCGGTFLGGARGQGFGVNPSRASLVEERDAA